MKKITPLYYWKIALFFLATMIGMTSIFYINRAVKEIANEERKKVELLTEAMLQISNDKSLSEQNLECYMKVIENNEIVPVIMVDKNDNIISFRNLNKKKTDKPRYIKRKLARMKKLAAPIEILISNDSMQYLYLGKSIIQNELSYFPSIQMVVILLIVSGIVLDIISITSG
jgi:hypothetical protein